MNLIISLDGNNIKLTLKEGRTLVDELGWEGEYSLSEMLLPNIDKLLEKAKVSKKEVTKVQAKISKVSGVTSSRIVQTVAKAWNAAN